MERLTAGKVKQLMDGQLEDWTAGRLDAWKPGQLDGEQPERITLTAGRPDSFPATILLESLTAGRS